MAGGHTVLTSSWFDPSTCCSRLRWEPGLFSFCAEQPCSEKTLIFCPSHLCPSESAPETSACLTKSLLSAHGRRQASGMKDCQSFLTSQSEMSNLWHLWGLRPKPPSILKPCSGKSLEEDPNYASPCGVIFMVSSTNRYKFAHIFYWFSLEGLVAVFTWCKLTQCESLPLTFLSSIYPKRLSCGQGLWLS